MTEEPDPGSQQAEQAKIARNALDELARELLKFSPTLVLATFVMVYRSARKTDRTFADAVAQQDWSGVLPPFKFCTSMLAIVALLVWTVDFSADGPSSLSIVSRDLIAIPFCVLALSIPMHFLLGMGRRAEGRVFGVMDGVVKIFQILFYGFSIWCCVFLVVFFAAGLGELSGQTVWLIVGIAVSIIGAVVVMLPLMVAIASALGKLYGVSGAWAFSALYLTGFVLVMAYSLITTGSLLPPDT